MINFARICRLDNPFLLLEIWKPPRIYCQMFQILDCSKTQGQPNGKFEPWETTSREGGHGQWMSEFIVYQWRCITSQWLQYFVTASYSVLIHLYASKLLYLSHLGHESPVSSYDPFFCTNTTQQTVTLLFFILHSITLWELSPLLITYSASLIGSVMARKAQLARMVSITR